MSDGESTRERSVQAIVERLAGRNEQLAVWRTTDLIEQIPDAEWMEMHAGTCQHCPATNARLYPGGWRCETHRP